MPNKSAEDEKFDAAENGLIVAMHELKEALAEGDIMAAARAFHAAFQCCECQPHEEYDKDEEADKPAYQPPPIE
jgi:hypothetical protein